MLQETVWALSNVQCPFCHVRAVFTEAATRGECSIKKGVLRNFAKFTGKCLCQSLLFNKVEGLFRTPPDNCFQS